MGRSTWWRAARNCLLVAMLGLIAYSWATVLPTSGLAFGHDLVLYQRHVQAILAGGPFYPVHELAGPFTIGEGDILYPPVAIVCFVPTLVLPLPLWWILPAVVVAVAFRGVRLRTWALFALLACLADPFTPELAWVGNPDIWLVAALAAALRWNRGLAALVLLKPSVFEFSIIGLRHRSWWAAAAVLAIASLILLPQTVDWFHVLANAQGAPLRSGLAYSSMDVPLLAMPLIAWFGRVPGTPPGFGGEGAAPAPTA